MVDRLDEDARDEVVRCVRNRIGEDDGRRRVRSVCGEEGAPAALSLNSLREEEEASIALLTGDAATAATAAAADAAWSSCCCAAFVVLFLVGDGDGDGDRERRKRD